MNATKNIVFITGWGFQTSIWHDVANKLSEYNVILCELPVLHASQNSLEDLAHLINQTLPNDCILIGWSFGGLIAMSLCQLYPKKYLKLIALTSSPKFQASHSWAGLSKANIGMFNNLLQKNLPRLHHKLLTLSAYPTADGNIVNFLQTHLLTANTELLHKYLSILAQTDLRNCYQYLTQPILQIFGEEDAIISEKIVTQLIKHYPQYPTYIIKGAGHIPFVTHQTEFLQCITLFIEK